MNTPNAKRVKNRMPTIFMPDESVSFVALDNSMQDGSDSSVEVGYTVATSEINSQLWENRLCAEPSARSYVIATEDGFLFGGSLNITPREVYFSVPLEILTGPLIQILR